MKQKFSVFLLILLMFLSLHCAGSRSSSSKAPTRFDFGRSTNVESLRAIISSTLRKYNHDLKVLGNFIETEWRYLPPNEEQELTGIKETRYKLTVNFRNRRNISYADVILQYEGRYEKGEWTNLNPNQDIVEFIENMQDEVKQQLQRYISQE